MQRRRFGGVLLEWPPEMVLGPVASRIDTDLHSEQLRARKEVADAMDSQRYLDILATLQRWRGKLPLATTPSAKRLLKRASRAERKADRRLVDAVESGDDALLHRARKAAKRARYAAELRRPLKASKAVRIGEALQADPAGTG